MLIKITVPEIDEADFRQAYSSGYEPKLPDGSDNPQTRTEYAKEQVRHGVASTIFTHRQQQLTVTNPEVTVE